MLGLVNKISKNIFANVVENKKIECANVGRANVANKIIKVYKQIINLIEDTIKNQSKL